MKKLLLLVVFISFLCVSALAQTEKGARMVGGTGTLHFNTEGEDGFSFVALTPRLGFFLVDNFAIGSAVPLIVSFSDDVTSSTIGITPFLRGYIGSSATRFLVEARAGYSQSRFKSKEFDYDEKEDFYTYGVGAGFVHFINEHVGMEYILSYDQADADESLLDYRNFMGINFNVGLQIHLPSNR
jgi:outer membrane protein